MGLFDQLFGGGQQAATDAANAKIQGLQQAQNVADPLYAQGRTAINTGYGTAQNLFAPLVATGQQGAQAYADITGAAGQAGQDRARALFQTDPGYQFARDQALQATQRLGGSGGFQGSGNVATALEDRAAGLASQQYGDYVNRLAPFLNNSLLATAGAANQYTGQGNALNTNLTGQATNIDAPVAAGIGSANAAGITGAAAAKSAELTNAAKLLGYAIPGANQVANLFNSSSGGSPYVNTQGSFPSFLSFG